MEEHSAHNSEMRFKSCKARPSGEHKRPRDSPLVKAQCDVKSSYIDGGVGCIVRERRLSPWRKDDLCQKSAVVVRPPCKKVFRIDSNERLRK